MRNRVPIVIAILVAGVTPDALAQRVTIAKVANHAVAETQLTLPGSSPFHLKATIAEKDSPASDYKGTIEMFWSSPGKWRRVIQSPGFSQTLVMNGDEVSEQDSGDYFPAWLRDFVTALFDPLPMLQSLTRLNTSIAKPRGSDESTSCARFESKVGVPPVQNSAFYVFCFAGDRGLLKSVVTPQYSAEFQHFEKFENKQVARTIVTYPEPGTTIEARIVDLSELTAPDQSLFAISNPTPPQDQLKSILVSDAVLTSMALQNPPISWPTVRSGKTSGVLSIYVSIDRSGRVRETFPLNSDNANLDDPVRRQVEKWQFKPALSGGVPVQVEGTLTFAFNTSTKNPVAILSDAQVRNRATNTVDPRIPPGIAASGTSFTLRVSVDTEGKLMGIGNPNNVSDALFLAGYAALKQWHFKPYLRDGKPDVYNADVTFRVP